MCLSISKPHQTRSSWKVESIVCATAALLIASSELFIKQFWDLWIQTSGLTIGSVECWPLTAGGAFSGGAKKRVPIQNIALTRAASCYVLQLDRSCIYVVGLWLEQYTTINHSQQYYLTIPTNKSKFQCITSDGRGEVSRKGPDGFPWN